MLANPPACVRGRGPLYGRSPDFADRAVLARRRRGAARRDSVALTGRGARPRQDGYTPAMVASKAGHPELAAVIAGGKPERAGEERRNWRVPPTPAPSLDMQLPDFSGAQRSVRITAPA